MCHFTMRSVAFSPSTRPIHCKNRGAERLEKMCNFTSRSVPRPRQSIVKIERGASRSEKCATFLRVFTFDLANPWEGLRVTPKMCHFTSRSVARPGEKCVILRRVQSRSVPRPGQSIVKIEAPNGWKKCATLPRVQSLDHANPS